MEQEPVYSEQEVARIIRRAAEISEEASDAPYVAGVTREELSRIASELGVAPGALDRAIRETQGRSSRHGLIRLTEEFERVIDGELDPSQFDVVLEGVKTFDRHGPALVGRSLRASAWTGVGQAHFEVSSRNGRTRLKVKSNSFFQTLMTLYPSFVATAILVPALAANGYGAFAAALGFGIMTAGAFICSKLIKRGHRNAEDLADQMQSRILAAITDQPAAVQETKAEVQPVPITRQAVSEPPAEQLLQRE